MIKMEFSSVGGICFTPATGIFCQQSCGNDTKFTMQFGESNPCV
jgi:hypothetical protein